MNDIKACPFCRAECHLDMGIVDHGGTVVFLVVCGGCTYRGTDERAETDAIAAHNRVAQAAARVAELEGDKSRGQLLAERYGATSACETLHTRITELKRCLARCRDAMPPCGHTQGTETDAISYTEAVPAWVEWSVARIEEKHTARVAGLQTERDQAHEQLDMMDQGREMNLNDRLGGLVIFVFVFIGLNGLYGDCAAAIYNVWVQK